MSTQVHTSAPDRECASSDRLLLLQPYVLGSLELPNRVVMAPLTRMRTPLHGAVPNDLMRDYYAQRAGAGLIITEGTFVSDQARGWFAAPGIYTEAQRRGWQRVTEAVHRSGGRIFVQLWHQGSFSSRELLAHGQSPQGPSAINPEQLVHVGYGKTEMSGLPAAMTLEDIQRTIAEFQHASRVALDAGLDGVQIQGGYVYLFQQFLHESLNRRSDRYGGSVENRARLLIEVVEAILNVWPSERVGVKAGPMMSERGAFRSVDSTITTAEYVYGRLNEYRLSHIMLMRQLASPKSTPLETLQGDAVLHHFRKFHSGNLIANVDISPLHGEELLRQGLVQLIAFGRDYIANPDLVERIRVGATFNPQRPECYYGATAEGYTDYPTLTQSKATVGHA